MIEEYYPDGSPYGDTNIIVDFIKQLIPDEEVDVMFTCQKDYVLATMYLRPPHNASWNISWAAKTPMILDTGDEKDPYPCIANPQCKEIVIEQLQRRYKELYRFCDCDKCRKHPHPAVASELF